ncbi:hypothetical protein AALP_AA8G014700 [Arabis alpina]|uniref:SANTA domain-containing protein n=1 Tax=Arabis alpina TaxID=50452 RepID=A0A087G4A7_ARAAL|nr:hypothetical protein AALP_AA8G014700 [Arabis alpina]
MVEHRAPNLDGDSENRSSSSFQRTVILRDWWLVKCSKEVEGKRFGVAGTEITASVVEKRAMRVFTSSPIIKAFDIFTLQASDGICITLQGFLDKKRVVESGFIPEISREFIFGFPPCWEQICNKCYGGCPLGTDFKSVHSIKEEACSPILSPCKNTKGNVENSPAESRDESRVSEKNMGQQARRKSPRRQPGGKRAEDVRKLELSKVKNMINDGDHGSEDLGKAKRSVVEKDECEAIDNEVASLDDGCGKRHTRAYSVDKTTSKNGREGLDKGKSSDVIENECEAIKDREVILPEDGCGRKHTGADNVDKLTSMSAGGESLTSEQRKGKLKVTKTSLPSLSKDLNNSKKPGKKERSKKSEKTLKGDCNVVEPLSHSGSKVKEAEETMSWEKAKRKIDFDLEVTPVKKPKKQNTDADSTGSVGQKRSRSGRKLVSPLEFWRNQVPVYDVGRTLIQVNVGHETNSTPSKGKGSDSRKARR